VVWLATGSHFWLLPNMMSEEVRMSYRAVLQPACHIILFVKALLDGQMHPCLHL
jgi:hypothetical protein